MYTEARFERFFLREVRPLEKEENAYIISRDTSEVYRQFGDDMKIARGPGYKAKKDTKNIDKRFYVGTLGEKATRCHLGLGEPDLSIDYGVKGHFKYHHMDLRNDGANVGIKSAQYPFTPMINPNDASEDAQIICSVYPNHPLGVKVYIIGIASSSNFKDAIDMEMKLEKKNECKGGFKGYQKLVSVPSMDVLRNIYPWPKLGKRRETIPTMVEKNPVLPIKDGYLFDRFMSDIMERSQK